MDVTTQRRSLTTVAAGLLLGAAGAVGWSVSGIESTIETRSTTVPAVVRSVAPSDELGSVEGLATSLRRPLVDPPPPEPRKVEPKPIVPVPKPTPSLQLTLVGTIIQSNKSLAIIADPSGKFDVKGVGESLELSPAGISVQSIDSEQVELEYQGKRSTVKLNKDAKKTQANGRAAKVRRRDR